MFNEAFWFFYLIGVVGSFSSLSWAVLVSLCIVGGFSILFGTLEDSPKARTFGFKLGAAAMVMAMLITVTPTQQSLYAGGAQYAVEVVELDDTLLAFKDIIDAKIADLAPDSGE